MLYLSYRYWNGWYSQSAGLEVRVEWVVLVWIDDGMLGADTVENRGHGNYKD